MSGFDVATYELIKKVEYAFQTKDMSAEEKAAHAEASQDDFQTLQNAVQQNDVQSLKNLLKKSHLTPVDFKVAFAIASKDKKNCKEVAEILGEHVSGQDQNLIEKECPL